MSDCIYLKIEDMSDWNSEAMGGHGDKKYICMKTGKEIPGSHIRCVHCEKRTESDTFILDEHADEIMQLEKELRRLIDYDEWSAIEHGETKVDYYWTAVNLLKVGYRKIGEANNE